jgi:WD40 repeat protein
MWSATFNHDASLVATFSADHTAIVWETATGKKWKRPLTHDHWIVGGAFSYASDRLFTLIWHSKLHVWNLNTSEKEASKQLGKDLAVATAFSGNAQFLIFANHNDAYLWSTDPIEMRSQWGAKVYADLCSVVATGRLAGRNALAAIRDALAPPAPQQTPA